MFGRGPSDARRFFVYSYQHLDDLGFLRAPATVFAEHYVSDQLDAWTEAIRVVLRDAGWEGDGDLQIMWFPPFVDVGMEDTYGTYAWVVKQNNNGTSWLASPVETRAGLPRLRSQALGAHGGSDPTTSAPGKGSKATSCARSTNCFPECEGK